MAGRSCGLRRRGRRIAKLRFPPRGGRRKTGPGGNSLGALRLELDDESIRCKAGKPGRDLKPLSSGGRGGGVPRRPPGSDRFRVEVAWRGRCATGWDIAPLFSHPAVYENPRREGGWPGTLRPVIRFQEGISHPAGRRGWRRHVEERGRRACAVILTNSALREPGTGSELYWSRWATRLLGTRPNSPVAYQPLHRNAGGRASRDHHPVVERLRPPWPEPPDVIRAQAPYGRRCRRCFHFQALPASVREPRWGSPGKRRRRAFPNASILVGGGRPHVPGIGWSPNREYRRTRVEVVLPNFVDLERFPTPRAPSRHGHGEGPSFPATRRAGRPTPFPWCGRHVPASASRLEVAGIAGGASRLTRPGALLAGFDISSSPKSARRSKPWRGRWRWCSADQARGVGPIGDHGGNFDRLRRSNFGIRDPAEGR